MNTIDEHTGSKKLTSVSLLAELIYVHFIKLFCSHGRVKPPRPANQLQNDLASFANSEFAMHFWHVILEKLMGLLVGCGSMSQVSSVRKADEVWFWCGCGCAGLGQAMKAGCRERILLLG